MSTVGLKQCIVGKSWCIVGEYSLLALLHLRVDFLQTFVEVLALAHVENLLFIP